jgi:hypothetical protein
MIWFCPDFWEYYINKHLVSSELTSRQASLLASNKASVFFFLYGIYVFSRYINRISIGQKLMCPIQFQFFRVLLDPPDGIFVNKFEKQRW